MSWKAFLYAVKFFERHRHCNHIMLRFDEYNGKSATKHVLGLSKKLPIIMRCNCCVLEPKKKNAARNCACKTIKNNAVIVCLCTKIYCFILGKYEGEEGKETEKFQKKGNKERKGRMGGKGISQIGDSLHQFYESASFFH